VEKFSAISGKEKESTLSRIGKAPIAIPEGVKIALTDSEVKVTGKLGELVQPLITNTTIKVDEETGQIIVGRSSDLRNDRAAHGLQRALLANMIAGVSEGYKTELEIQGVGYTVEARGVNILLKLGFTHGILFKPPAGIKLELIKNTGIIISGIDKQLVGQVSADIRKLKPPEPYKGKGIRYKGEHVTIKPGKAAKTAEA